MDDAILEEDENFFANLSTTDPAVNLSPEQAEAIIIEDNDSMPLPFA